MRHEYAVHAGVYEDTWHDYETHKRRKIWRADRGSQGMGGSSEGGLGTQ